LGCSPEIALELFNTFKIVMSASAMTEMVNHGIPLQRVRAAQLQSLHVAKPQDHGTDLTGEHNGLP